MTFEQLLTEFYSRGYDYLNQDAAGRTRAERWINEAYLEDICAAYPWDFLKASTTDTAPLTIADLDQAIGVVDTTNQYELQHLDLDAQIDTDPILTTAGAATSWYMSDESTLAVYPLDTTSSFRVDYYKVPSELTVAGDTPAVPSRWRGLIVDGAVIRALVDADNHESAAVLQARFDRRLMQMAARELVRTIDPSYIQSR